MASVRVARSAVVEKLVEDLDGELICLVNDARRLVGAG